MEDAVKLSGYDGVSRFVHEFNQGNQSVAHTIAAEECVSRLSESPVNVRQSSFPLAQTASRHTNRSHV